MLLFTCPARLRATVKLPTGRATYWTKLPDAVLKDIGLARSDIPFIAGKLVYKCKDPARDAIDRFDWNAVWRNATILRLPETVLRLTLVAAATVSAVFVLSSAVLA